MINYFISDLHLDENEPHKAALFTTFLTKITAKNHQLYILGDFFEYWIGDDHLSPFNQTICHALKTATQRGLTIYIMRGNRDFLLGKKFFNRTGCHLLPDEHVVLLGDQLTLLMHGDTLCTNDVNYLRFRKKTRNKFLQILFLLKPLKKRIELANTYRKKSQEYTSQLPPSIMDVSQEEVQRIMQKHGVKELIHGHTHQPGIHRFTMNHQPAARTVLASWESQGSALVVDPHGKKAWMTITS